MLGYLTALNSSKNLRQDSRIFHPFNLRASAMVALDSSLRDHMSLGPVLESLKLQTIMHDEDYSF